MTAMTAKKAISKSKRTKAASDKSAQPKHKRSANDCESTRAISLEILQTKLKLPATIKQIVKRGREGGIFDMRLEIEDGNGYKRDQTVTLGSTAVVLSETRMRTAIADSLGHVIPFVKKWQPIAQLIFNATEIIETLSEDDETRNWLEQLTSSSGVFSSLLVDLSDNEAIFEQLNDKYMRGHSFADTEGRLHISLAGLAEFVNTHHLSSKRVSQRNIAERLSLLGFVSQPVSVRRPQQSTPLTRRFWVSPEEVEPRAMTEQGASDTAIAVSTIH